MIGKILVIVMLAFSIIMIPVILVKADKFKKFFLACTIVYVTGNLLITAIVFLNQDIPLVFAIISEITILFVFGFSMYMIYKLGKSTEEVQKAQFEAQQKKDQDKTAE